jgi:GDP-D-mannose dehydratase
MSEFWNGKNVLITGVTGFVGSWLAETLTSDKYKANVFGLIRRQANPSVENIKHLIKENKIKLLRGDIGDLGSLVNVLKESKAEVVFHLAAQSFVPHSFSSPIDTFHTNVMGTTNILEAVKIVDKNIKVHFAGSSEEYGLVIVNDEHYKRMLDNYKVILPFPEIDQQGKVIPEIPIKESNPLRTVGTSPYGCSKRMAENVCRTYASCYGMNIFTTRAFNHTGPRRGREFVTSEITSQIAQGIKHGKDEIILGNLEAIRDFTDVRDIVDGYLKVIEKGVPGDVYNLCSGKGLSINQLMELAISIAKRDFGLKHEMKYVMNKDRLRPTDLPILIGDNSKAKKELGWEPKIPIEQTLKEMIEFYIERV